MLRSGGRQALLASALALGAHACASVDGKADKSALEIRPVTSAEASASATDGLYRDAVSAISRRDYATALDALQAARDRTPKDPRILNAFGVVYDKLGRFDLSQRYYAQAQTADPTSPIVAENMAYSQVLQGKAPQAAVAYAAAAAKVEAAAKRSAPETQVAIAVEPRDAPIVILPRAAPVQRAALAQAAPETTTLAPDLAPEAAVAEAAPEVPAQSQVARAPAAPSVPWTAVALEPANAVGAAALHIRRAPPVTARPSARRLTANLETEAAPPSPGWSSAELRPFETEIAGPPVKIVRIDALRARPVAGQVPSFVATEVEAAPQAQSPAPTALLYPVSWVTVEAPPTILAAEPSQARPEAVALAFTPAPSAKAAPAAAAPSRALHHPHFAFVRRAFVQLAHVLRLPQGAERLFGRHATALAKAGDANALAARPGAVSVATQAHEAVADEAASPAPVASSTPAAPAQKAKSGQVAAAATPLLGQPIRLVSAGEGRYAAKLMRRRLAGQGWSVVMASEPRARAPEETIIRYEAPHARVALGLAHSLKAPVRLEACRSACGGVTLILSDAAMRQASARPSARRTG